MGGPGRPFVLTRPGSPRRPSPLLQQVDTAEVVGDILGHSNLIASSDRYSRVLDSDE